MILDRLFCFTGIGTTAPSNNDGLNDTITTAVTGQAMSGTVDIGVGLQTTTNPSGLAIPGVAAGAGARDLGIGDDPSLKFLVEVTAYTSGGTNIFIAIAGAPDSGSGTPGSFTTYATGPTIAVAQIAAGTRLLDLDMPRVAFGAAMPRYLQLLVTSTGTFTGLLFRAYALLDRIDQPFNVTSGALSAYPPGITIAN